MARKNPLVKLGRPPSKPPSTSSFSPGIPAKAFSRGGAVPAYHDCPRMSKSHGEHGFASAKDHFCRGGKA